MDTEMIIKQQSYKLLICFFARELHPHHTSIIYDCLLCGTLSSEHNAFEGLIKLILSFLFIMKDEYHVHFNDLFEFNTANHTFFKNITEQQISELIQRSWLL